MKIKWVIFGVLIVFLIPAMILRSKAVDTRQIEQVRNKQVLNSEDLQIIDDFLAQTVQELVKTRDFTSIARTRTVILTNQSNQGQYAQQFSESAYKYISLGLQQATELPQERQFKVILNLLILVDGLKDPRLADLAIARLKDKNKAIRYWAVRCVTNPGLLMKLNPPDAANLRLARRIAEELSKLVDSSDPEILALMAEFTDEVNIPEGQDLLLQIADIRIKQYADWRVEYELLDSAILKFLCNKVAPDRVGGSSSPAVARRFGQLYSYAIQRYIKGQEYLRQNNKHYLASVLVETEDKCIGKLLGRPQSAIKRAVESATGGLLLQEYNRLFGDEIRAGELTLKLNIDYGDRRETSDERRETKPHPLPDPPKTNTQIR